MKTNKAEVETGEVWTLTIVDSETGNTQGASGCRSLIDAAVGLLNGIQKSARDMEDPADWDYDTLATVFDALKEIAVQYAEGKTSGEEQVGDEVAGGLLHWRVETMTTQLDPNETTITKEQAELIRKAFGPCTAVYECKTAEDLRDEFNLDVANKHLSTIGQFVTVLYDVEEVHHDRELGFIEDDKRHAKAVKEYREQTAGIRERLEEIGLKIDREEIDAS